MCSPICAISISAVQFEHLMVGRPLGLWAMVAAIELFQPRQNLSRLSDLGCSCKPRMVCAHANRRTCRLQESADAVTLSRVRYWYRLGLTKRVSRRVF
jgi:hypothetical protein